MGRLTRSTRCATGSGLADSSSLRLKRKPHIISPPQALLTSADISRTSSPLSQDCIKRRSDFAFVRLQLRIAMRADIHASMSASR